MRRDTIAIRHLSFKEDVSWREETERDRWEQVREPDAGLGTATDAERRGICIGAVVPAGVWAADAAGVTGSTRRDCQVGCAVFGEQLLRPV
jgi:hypothetical protein